MPQTYEIHVHVTPQTSAVVSALVTLLTHPSFCPLTPASAPAAWLSWGMS
jgi:hypothetical protein